MSEETQAKAPEAGAAPPHGSVRGRDRSGLGSGPRRRPARRSGGGPPAARRTRQVLPPQEGVQVLHREDRRDSLPRREAAARVCGRARQDCAAAAHRRLHHAPAPSDPRHQAGPEHRPAAVCHAALNRASLRPDSGRYELSILSEAHPERSRKRQRTRRTCFLRHAARARLPVDATADDNIWRISMEVILKEDVANLGLRGEVVKVADGYGRNFLLPRKLAMQATAANKAVIEQMKAAAARRSATEKAQAEELVTKLEPRRAQLYPQVGRGRPSLRLGHLGRHRRGAGGARASRSIAARFSWASRSRAWATSRWPSSCTAKSPRT